MISVFLCVSLASCSPDGIIENAEAELELFRAEYSEIMQFFDKSVVYSTEPSVYALTAELEEKSLPHLTSLPHTEMLETPYYSGRKVIYDSGTPDTPASIPGNLSAYTAIPHFADRNAQAVTEYLRAHGIQADVKLGNSTAPAGEVYAIKYAGYSKDGVYYINPSVGVVLYVSNKKDAQSEPGQRQNLVYLTFDDGPTERDTVRLLDILDSYGVKAAFFTMGSAVQKYPASAKAISDRGHVLGCHTVTHNYSAIYASTSALMSEVTQWEQIVADAGIELKSKLFRFPGGSVGSYLKNGKAETMTASLEEMGYTVFDWNVVTNDSILYMAPSGTNTYDYIRENFISTFESCLWENEKKENAPIIILMHETVPETVDLMPWMLEYLIDKGFVFGDLATFGESWTFADR